MMQNRLHDLRNQARTLFITALKDDNAGDELSSMLAKVCDLLRDCEGVAANPQLKRMNCIHYGDLHISAYGGLHTLCGNGPKLTDTFVPSFAVPTCPECIQKWSDQQAKRTAPPHTAAGDGNGG